MEVVEWYKLEGDYAHLLSVRLYRSAALAISRYGNDDDGTQQTHQWQLQCQV